MGYMTGVMVVRKSVLGTVLRYSQGYLEPLPTIISLTFLMKVKKPAIIVPKTVISLLVVDRYVTRLYWESTASRYFRVFFLNIKLKTSEPREFLRSFYSLTDPNGC